jgi:hypothetical protein
MEVLIYGRIFVGARERPRGVAPETSEEFLTPSRVMLSNSQKRFRHQWWKILTGSFLPVGFDVLSIERASFIPN